LINVQPEEKLIESMKMSRFWCRKKKSAWTDLEKVSFKKFV